MAPPKTPEEKERELRGRQILALESRATAKLVTDILDTHHGDIAYQYGLRNERVQIQFDPGLTTWRQGPCLSILGKQITFGRYSRRSARIFAKILLSEGHQVLEQQIGRFIDDVVSPRSYSKYGVFEKKAVMHAPSKTSPVILDSPYRPLVSKVFTNEHSYAPWYSWTIDPK